VYDLDKDLQDLVALGKAQGFLTYDQVNDYLPDEAVHPEKLDTLLAALEDQGIELVSEAPDLSFAEESRSERPRPVVVDESASSESEEHAPSGDAPASVDSGGRWSDDPVRLYLTQMAEIPLLTREQEISLAKRIEVTRKRFRRTLLSCFYALKCTVDTLERVHRAAACD